MSQALATWQWLAPEVLEGEHYDERSDIYSLGIVLYEVETGLVPFNEFQQYQCIKLLPAGNAGQFTAETAGFEDQQLDSSSEDISSSLSPSSSGGPNNSLRENKNESSSTPSYNSNSSESSLDNSLSRNKGQIQAAKKQKSFSFFSWFKSKKEKKEKSKAKTEPIKQSSDSSNNSSDNSQINSNSNESSDENKLKQSEQRIQLREKQVNDKKMGASVVVKQKEEKQVKVKVWKNEAVDIISAIKKQSLRPTIPTSCCFTEIIQKCWSKNVEERPSPISCVDFFKKLLEIPTSHSEQEIVSPNNQLVQHSSPSVSGSTLQSEEIFFRNNKIQLEKNSAKGNIKKMLLYENYLWLIYESSFSIRDALSLSIIHESSFKSELVCVTSVNNNFWVGFSNGEVGIFSRAGKKKKNFSISSKKNSSPAVKYIVKCAFNNFVLVLDDSNILHTFKISSSSMKKQSTLQLEFQPTFAISDNLFNETIWLSSSSAKLFGFNPKENKISETIQLETKIPIHKMFLNNSSLFIACDDQIFVFDTERRQVLKQFQIPHKNVKNVEFLSWSFNDEFHIWILCEETSQALIYNGFDLNKLKAVKVGNASACLQMAEGNIWIANKSGELNEWIYV